MPKTEAQIREDVEIFDMIEDWGAVLIAAGLAVEVVYAIVFRSGRSFWEQWTPTIANFLVLAGVIIEARFARWSGESRDKLELLSKEKVAEANARAAEANERANKAELETERLRISAAWRHLSLETVKTLGDELAKIPPRVLAIVLTMGDVESRSFAREFDAVFKHSGWQTIFVVAGYAGDPIYGLRISVAYTDERRDMGMRLRDAFTSAGIEFIPGEPPRAFMTTPSDHPPSGQMAVLYVGPKGEPDL